MPDTEKDELTVEILQEPLRKIDVLKARRFLESCTYSVIAVRALVEAMRLQYAEARREGLREDDSTPCADIIASILPAFAAAEAKEI